ncbi:MAG: NADH-quinone oxidoreductase subunit NuoF [Bacteroidota bacterium]|nr:NADH-quinone oxidoreductase subunit NuoF [Bacteroidota bacterium]MDP4234375.1 NADH-quinone oxidoreductase subunit NuoF [Bacteroidota bacterium]MDP4243308.1 NADH-quinone oxidoreductase subunit NuoF [Bacteroidota bacterium]MDP4287993.1 NADH-quinone oxidoreductase subunit NuoF [Bacteroidota bacterium]
MADSPKLILPDVPGLRNIETYMQHGGYGETLRKVFTMSPTAVTDEVKKSGLRGRGGAAFPTGLKWSFMPKGNEKKKYLLVNGDESEPGSFKDRQIFEFNPHQMIEGILIASYAMQIDHAYIYIRGEYEHWIKMVRQAVAEAYDRGVVGPRMKDTFKPSGDGIAYSVDITVHKGAGAYIVGEETAMMSSLEGDRGYPRVKPPFPAASGLWHSPTTINNIETLANVPVILKMGGDAYSKIGDPKHPGTLLFGVSGHVNKPGVYELPTGTTLLDIINKHAGGVPGGKKIKMVIPGGSSMPPLRGEQLEGVKMDAENLKAAGSAIGTGGIMVMDEDTDIIKVLTRISKFYAHESCGQCTPCREGTGWLLKILQRFEQGNAREEDIDLLHDVAFNIEGRTICALGEAAAWPVRFTVERFREVFEQRVKPGLKIGSPNRVHALRKGGLEPVQIHVPMVERV